MAKIPQPELRVVDLLVESWVTGHLPATLNAELEALNGRANWPSVSVLVNKMVNVIRNQPQGRGPESAEDVRRYLIDSLAAMELGAQPPRVDLNCPPPGLREPEPAPVPEPAPPRVEPRRNVVDRQAMLSNLLNLWRTGQLSPELEQQLNRFGPLADRPEFLGKFVRSAREQPRTYPFNTENSVRVYLEEHLRQLLPDPPPEPPPLLPPRARGGEWTYGNELWQALADAQSRAETQAKLRDDAAALAIAKARAEFAAIWGQVAQARSRDELVKLGRRLDELAPRTCKRFSYQRPCWNCNRYLSWQIHPRCPECHLLICTCLPEGACWCNCPDREPRLYNRDDTY